MRTLFIFWGYYHKLRQILNIKYFREKHGKCNVICIHLKHMKGIYAEIEMEYINLWQILFIRDDLLKLI